MLVFTFPACDRDRSAFKSKCRTTEPSEANHLRKYYPKSVSPKIISLRIVISFMQATKKGPNKNPDPH